MKETRAKLSITIENFKISQVEEELELPKCRLNQKIRKSYFIKQTITLSKKSLILNLFTYIKSTYKMLHLLFKVKKCLDVCESNKQQTSNEHMAFLPYIFVLFCSPAVSTTTPNSVGEGGAITSPAGTSGTFN